MTASRNKAFVMVYTVIILIALLAMVSFAVDWGRVQAAKAELEDATDAAARYAATGISDNTAVAKAQASALENKVDGVALALQSSDIDIGTWNSGTKAFSVGGASPNAVRVVGHRNSSRGNPVPLVFANAVGRRSVDLNATTIATITTVPAAYDVVGLNSVTLSGSGKIKRWASESGTVNVASNGTFSLSWGQQILGNVLYRNTAPNTPNGANCITGTMTAMSSDLAFPTPTVPGGATVLNSVNYGNGNTYNLAAGNYSCTTFTIGGGATLNIQGDVNFYCSGTVNIGGGSTINTSGTTNKLTIYQTTASTITFNMSSTLYVRIYAPLSSMTDGGASPLIGSFVVKDAVVNGSGVFSYSSALPIPIAGTGGGGGSGSGGTIAMVD